MIWVHISVKSFWWRGIRRIEGYGREAHGPLRALLRVPRPLRGLLLALVPTFVKPSNRRLHPIGPQPHYPVSTGRCCL
jgi:hypothetical protein